MRKLTLDLTGKQFGNWTVIAYVGSNHWQCQCACGTLAKCQGQNLRKGKTQSCGCMKGTLIREKRLIDLTGQRFGRLLVLYRSRTSRNNHACWFCQCDCGNTCIIQSDHLRRKHTMSCGCLHKEILKNFPHITTTHGMRHSPEYKTYARMKQRCVNPHDPSFKDYGGRGISMEWQSFEDFYHDMGPRPSPQYSIDRINNDGNYSKDNCRWATPREQANNTRTNRLITYNGQTLTLSQWAKETGIPYGRLQTRAYQNFPLERVFFPLRYKTGPKPKDEQHV